MSFDMICTCSLEGIKKVEERRLRVCSKLGLDKIVETTQAVIMSLAFDFGAEIFIAVDMWFGVVLKSRLLEQNLYVECDDPADALYFFWESLDEKLPHLSCRKGLKLDTAEISYTKDLYDLLVALESRKISHRENEKDNQNHDPEFDLKCESCQNLMDEYLDVHWKLNAAWGAGFDEMAALHEAINKIFDEFNSEKAEI